MKKYIIKHTMVGTFKAGEIVTDKALQGDGERLLALGAVEDYYGPSLEEAEETLVQPTGDDKKSGK